MKHPPLLILMILLFFSIDSCKTSKSEEVLFDDLSRPNIIFILTDDQRWDALGYAGNSIIKTPNMDKLAGEGIYFEDAMVTTPICAASRATLFTGLYERTHNYTFGQPELANEYMLQSYPYLLRKNGYKTGMIGKFGVKVNDGITDSLFNYMETTFWPYLKEINGKEVHLADINGDLAIEFIEEYRDHPFCLSLSFWSPHADDGAKEQYFWPQYYDSLYHDIKIPEPANSSIEFFENLPEYLKTTMNRKRWHWRFDTPEKYQAMVKGYYRMISTVDSVIARIKESLISHNIADNTVIIIMGDNGYFLGERGYAGKWLMYEQSIKVPLMIYDPRLPEKYTGKKYDEMVLNVDVTPTILDLAGIEIPERYQGKSLLPFYKGVPAKWRNAVFCEHLWENNDLIPRTECYRDGSWKFIRYPDNPELIELYKYSVDINETANHAHDPEYSDLINFYNHKCDSIISSLLTDRVKE